MLRGFCRGELVAAHLWLVRGDVAYSHLAASSREGYRLGAAYALYAKAIEHFRSELRFLNLGAGAGGDSASGLERFKRGWATGTRPVYLCGKVFDKDAYERLSRAKRSAAFFPAYREPGGAAMTRIPASLKEKGWAYFDGIVDEDLLLALGRDLEKAEAICRRVRSSNGVDTMASGSLHHIVGLGESFTRFLEKFYLAGILREFLGGPVILNSFGGVINRKDDRAYFHGIHRDSRPLPLPFPLLINMLVLIDDFTLENGATYLLSGSHRGSEKPAEDLFYSRAERAVGKRGGIYLFDSQLWHAAGMNGTASARRGLTLTFSRSFLKQQLDYPRYLGAAYGESLTPELRQLLGYDSRVPTSLEEWYQPSEKRFYKPGQD